MLVIVCNLISHRCYKIIMKYPRKVHGHCGLPSRVGANSPFGRFIADSEPWEQRLPWKRVATATVSDLVQASRVNGNCLDILRILPRATALPYLAIAWI